MNDDNQPPPLENYNVFASDRALADSLRHLAPDCGGAELTELGALAGRAETLALGFDANEHPPQLRTHDRFGNRIDEVRFHPSWHALLHYALTFGLGGAAWSDAQPHPHLRRAAKFYVWSQVEAGHGCPVSMTYAAVPVLASEPAIAGTWVRAFTANAYDPRPLPIAQKDGALCGMAMTERRGGSDVRSNRTQAIAVSGRGHGEPYRLTGQKWFCSAPASDAFLVLAQVSAAKAGAGERLSCFLVPRTLADGSRNVFRIVRLKDKLGNRSNASAEVEFDGTQGYLIGDEGEGLRRIVEMVNHTRLDCAVGSAGLMRAALVQAVHHAAHRRAFGKLLIDQPLMQNVLAELALESEAATALCLRIAHAVDRANADSSAAAVARIGTALAKYYVCKRAPLLAGEALECLGGNGYVEESVMPRLYREAPVNSIWEGSGNINALDVLRILQRNPETFEAWRNEIAPACGDTRLAAAMHRLEGELRGGSAGEAQARSIAERMALLWQAALLSRWGPSFVAEAFSMARIGEGAGRTLGTLPAGVAFSAIVERAMPTDRSG